jgi:hypothetical protein
MKLRLIRGQKFEDRKFGTSLAAILLVQNLRRLGLKLMACQPCPPGNKLLPFARCCRRAIPIFFLLSGLAGAQSKLLPNVDVFGGYSHMALQSGGLGLGDFTQMNGFEVSVAVPHIVKSLGVMADASGHYSSGLEQYNWAIGPTYKLEFTRFRVIAHALYGKAQTRFRDPGSTFIEPSDRQRSLIFGVELDYPIGKRLNWRVGDKLMWRIQGDWVYTTAFNETLYNIRASTGLVYRFGKH